MEPLVKVLKLVDQDKKPTLSIIYEAMDRAKLAIKASVKQWEKYWEVIDRKWEGQLHRHLHAAAYFLNPMFQYSKHFSNHPEIKVGLKEVIKRLEPDLDRQAKVKLFVDGQGEFGSALTKKAINQSLPDEWIREGEEPILSSDNLDWLDKGLPTNEEGRERDVDSRRKGKASRTISSSSSSDDGDNRGSRRGGGTSEGNRGVGGTSEGTRGDGSTGGDYVSQVDPACHGHKEVKITMPHKIQSWISTRDMGTTKAFGLTTFPNDDDYSSGHDYHRSNHHRIDEHLQNLGHSNTGTRASDSYGYDQSSSSSSIAYRGFGYYQAGVDLEQPSKPYFPDYGSSSQSSHPPYSSYEQLFQSYPHYGNCHPNLYARRRTDDDDFEPLVIQHGIDCYITDTPRLIRLGPSESVTDTRL
ncbi:hypothetical protein CK203_101438 [Vitis vinifera]|uniref:Uncharacterized protein n=1 Tax=Vitis vinifera TaxID=29760 RepID=A0A438BRG9_VITVI|nr:hypothetical protein CK203_101438 [Vitis vinifera]